MESVIANIRTDCYVMLASFLEHAPSKIMLDILQDLRWDEAVPDAMASALRALRQASHDYSVADMQDEFNVLFVGLGCGEMVPYASWYRERTTQSSALASLRSDLIRLGIVRQAGTYESEDHAGTLCEIMAIISRKPNDEPYATQATFFQRHIVPWMMTFFEDLRSARSARFYRAVGLFGSCFLKAESEYLGLVQTSGFLQQKEG